ncbi:MAG: hypothetical protein GX456_18235 [Verrucomicrobia bacterium]|nr:hypothetical protein [Verrucomicrobiota bacterium]
MPARNRNGSTRLAAVYLAANVVAVSVDVAGSDGYIACPIRPQSRRDWTG